MGPSLKIAESAGWQPNLRSQTRSNPIKEVQLAPAVAAEERRVTVQTDPQEALPDEAARPQAAEAVADLPDVCPGLFDRVESPSFVFLPQRFRVPLIHNCNLKRRANLMPATTTCHSLETEESFRFFFEKSRDSALEHINTEMSLSA